MNANNARETQRETLSFTYAATAAHYHPGAIVAQVRRQLADYPNTLLTVWVEDADYKTVLNLLYRIGIDEEQCTLLGA